MVEFNWYLNRQGLRGLTGPKGDQGFSPYFTVEQSTANEYRLRVHNEDSSFVTENLRGNAIEIRNPDGNYIKYDHETGNFYVDDADYATTDVEGQIILATMDDLVIGNETKAVTPALLLDSLSQLLVNTDGNLSITQNQDNSLTEINLANEVIHPNLKYSSGNNYLITGDIRYNYPIVVTKGTLDDTGRRGCTLSLNYNSSHFQISNNSLSLSSAITNNINFIRNDLEEEKTVRGNADTQLQSAINAERREREQQDSDLTTHINLVRTESETSDAIIRQDIQRIEGGIDSKLSVDNIIAGDNITLDVNGNNITINSTGGSGGTLIDDENISTNTVFSSSKTSELVGDSIANLVTLNTAQSITGQKTFTKQVNVPSGVLKSTDGKFVIEGSNDADVRINNLNIKKGTTGSVYGLELSGGTSGSTILFDKANLCIRDDENKVYSLLHYGNLTSKDGSIEIKYNTTTKTVDLKAVGGGGSYTLPIASASTLGGIKGGNWLTVNQSTGKLECGELSYAQYQSALGYTFISKTTLENVLANRPSGGAEIDDENVSKTKVFSSSRTSDLIGEVGNDLQDLTNKVNELELYKTPNATIIGNPTINQGQITNLTTTSYLQFPLEFAPMGRAWEAKMQITTDSTAGNYGVQQNIIDSNCSIAVAIKNGHFVFAFSINGTSWREEVAGTYNVLPNTTYYLKLHYDPNGSYGNTFYLSYSLDDFYYEKDANNFSTWTIASKPIYISGSGHPFKGVINLNGWSLTIGGNLVWQGMDSVGVATRADRSLSNIDDAGKQVIRDVAGVEDIEEALNLLNGGDSTLLDSKQNKLVAGNGITIDPETNVISATGGGSGGGGDMTTNTDQDVTGVKNFIGSTLKFSDANGNYTNFELKNENISTPDEYSGISNYLDVGGKMLIGKFAQKRAVFSPSDFRIAYSPCLDMEGLVAGDGVNITKNYGNDTVTISVTGGGGGADNIFVAEYGTTTYDEVKAAHDANKQVFVKRTVGSSDNILRLTKITSSTMDFSCVASSTRYNVTLSSTNVWTWGSSSIPITTTNVTSGSNSALTSGGAYTNLVRRTELGDVIPVKSRVVSGASQVTIWSDGYCEQCGLMSRTAAKETVALAKAFANSDYNIIIQPRHTADSTDGRPPLIRDVTPTGFEINSYTTYAQFYWVAKGKLAQGEY